MTLPWSIDEAGTQLRQASRFQQEAEDQLKQAHRDAAGAEDVATLRRERDVAVGLREAAQQACWRRAADRRDCQALCGWSERQMFAEAAGRIEHTFEKPIGTLAR